VHNHPDRQADRIGEDMPLAAVDLLASVIPSRSAGLGRLDRLTVYHAGGGAGFAPGSFTHLHQHDVVDDLPDPAVTPIIKVPLHGRVWREILRQHAPLTARLGNVEDRIDGLSQVGLTRPSAVGRRWQMRLDQCPLFVGDIACIAQPIAPIFRARDSSPGHDPTPRRLRKPERIVAAGITQPRFMIGAVQRRKKPTQNR
jgi:hypothetical protein